MIPFDEDTLTTLHERGVLAEIDRHFARAVARLCPRDPPLVALGAALCSRAVQAGHVCLDLAHAPPFVDGDGETLEVSWPAPEAWRAALEQSPAVSDGSAPTPLVLLEDRLYLHRYARYEARLVACLEARLSAPFELDTAFLAERFLHYFGPSDPAGPLDEQRLATLLALQNRLAVISGGPGTGKTWAVTRLLLLLAEHEARLGKPLDVALLAPTGKAAQRLTESLSRGLAELGIAPEASPVPVTASTIHRALGPLPRAPTRFRHGADRPLPHHLVVVDEASMVDLALMTKLVEAIAPDARLVLLGDRDQLASVEAGAIFGDILGSGAPAGYSAEVVAIAERVLGQSPPRALAPVPIADCLVHLSRSRRYVDDSGIGRVAKALRTRDSTAALEALTREADARLVEMGDDVSELERVVLEGYRGYAEARDPAERLRRLEHFRLLTAHRAGPHGVEAMNSLSERVLARHTPLRPTPGPYDGRPILVVDNDYQLELWNGDVGVVGSLPGGERLVAYFQRAEGVRTVPLSRLPSHETVFAMTVHKSQGSEFDQVALVLPQRPSPVLTRELVYTAITRARQRVHLFGTRAVLESGLSTEIRRASGLAAALRGAAPGEEKAPSS